MVNGNMTANLFRNTWRDNKETSKTINIKFRRGEQLLPCKYKASE